MKKIVLSMAAAALAFFASCSNNSDNGGIGGFGWGGGDGSGGTNGTGVENDGAGGGVGEIISVKSVSTKSLFTGSYEASGVESGNHSALSMSVDNNETVKLENALLTINSYGNVEPIQFFDSNGNSVVLNISNLKQLSEKSVLLRFNGVATYYENNDEEGKLSTEKFISGTCLVNFETNKVYNLTGYDINDSYYSNGTLFIKKGSCALYKIDL